MSLRSVDNRDLAEVTGCQEARIEVLRRVIKHLQADLELAQAQIAVRDDIIASLTAGRRSYDAHLGSVEGS